MAVRTKTTGRGPAPAVVLLPVALLLAWCVLPVARLHAQEERAPEEVAFDRFVLVNGEVHDGRFLGVRDGAYQLESEGFGRMEVDPENVREIHLLEPRRLYAKEGPRARPEPITLRSEDGRLIMRRNDEPEAQPFTPTRFELVQPEPIPFAVWRLNLQGTASIARGNADTIGAGISAELTRTSDFDELLFGYEFGYQETELDDDSTVVSERFHRAELGYRYFVEPWWGLFAHDSFRHNLISGIELWNTLQGGISLAPALWGDPLTLTFDFGILWAYRDLTGEPGEHYVGGSTAMRATWQAKDRLRFRFRAEIDLNFENTNNWNGLLRLTSRMSVTDMVAAGFVAELTYVNQPAPGFNATDFRMLATLGILI